VHSHVLFLIKISMKKPYKTTNKKTAFPNIRKDGFVGLLIFTSQYLHDQCNYAGFELLFP